MRHRTKLTLARAAVTLAGALTRRTAAVLVLVVLTATTAWASDFSGSGTEADPYKIANYSDLKTLHDNVNNGEAYDGVYFKQTADIDWPANTTWTSGIGTDADRRFGGHYDGDGKAIRRLTISGTSTYTGLFGYVRGASYGHGNFKQTTLKNIVLEDCYIDASSVSGSYAAGICAFIPNATRVDNCRVSGTISATSYASGITCIYEHSLIFVTNCFADVTVSALNIGKIFAETTFSAHIVGNYYHDNGDGVGSTDPSFDLSASEAAPLYTVSGSGFTTAATNATITHAGKHYFASGATVTLTTDVNNIITGTPAVSGTGASVSSVATDKKSITVTVGSADVTVSVCSGTENDPYLIASYDDLLALRNNVNGGEAYDGKYFKQTADIDCPANTTWTSGIGTYADHRFGGHYDGDGKAIRRLTISGTSTYTALFGYVRGASNGKGGYYPTTLKNIVLEDCNIQTTGNYAAGILAVAYSENTVENCRVSGTINGNTAAGGIVGYENQGKVKNCFADVTVTASVQTVSPSGVTIKYSTVGKIIGYVVGLGSSGDVTGNNYHDDGATDGAGHAVTAIGRTATITYSDNTHATPVYTVGSTNLTAAATNATVTHAGTHYFAAGATATLTTDGNHLISGTPTVSGTGASLGSVASDKKSMTLTVGTADVTVTATLQTITGPCGTNATWRMSDTNGDGIYETLTIRGTGAITSSPWDADFAATIQRVNIGRTDLTISGNPFSTLADGAVIAVPTPAYAIGYSSAAYASKMHVGVGSQLFTAIGTVDDAACEIATEADLRNLATAVNQDDQYCSGLTFRQTAPITLNGDIAPIGIFGSAYFKGTYDGGGNTISGLSISGNYHRAGLFGFVTDGTVKNVGLVSPVVTSSYKNGDSGAIVGAIAGRAYSAHIENCWVYNPTVSATGSGTNYVGAIVGMSTNDEYTNLYFYDSDNSHSYAAVGYITDNPSLTNVSRAYALTLGSGVTTSTTPAFSYNNVSYYVGTVTLDAPAGWVYDYTVNGTPIDGTSFTISANSTVACTKSINPVHFEQTATNEYTIHTAAGWGVFSDLIADGESFSGKTVKLGANISVSRMAGSGDNPFCGNFDGGGNTLTFTADAADNYCAPFVGVKGGTTADDATTIGNLNVVTTITANDYRHTAGLIALQWGHVNVSGCNATVNISSTVGTSNPHDLYPAALVSQASSSNGGTLTVTGCTASGTISTDGKYAAGLVGIVQGTASISDCVSSVTINSSVNGDGTHGGIVAALSGATNIYGTVFNGRLLGTATESVGGFIGWRNNTATIYNSLFIPAEVTVKKDNSATFARNDVDTHNCYYTYYLCDGEHYVPYYATDGITRRNGHATRTVAPAADVTIEAVALTGTATQYNVSGITAYSGGGLQRGQTLYYGSGDQLSLTLSNTATGAPLGYQYGYTASAGTLSGTTLTMPDQDVTISTALAAIDWATVNEGTIGNPYMIYNKDQLLLLAHRVNGTNGETANTYQGKYFKLGADITFTHAANEGDDYAENYEAIGTYIDGTYRYFNGDFDGDGHTVSGIRIRKTTGSSDYQGLFGLIDSGADIHDVHLTDARIKGYNSVGGIVGYNYGTVSGCSVTDSYITATDNWNYGTICGWNGGTLTNNYYHGCTVNGTENATNVGCGGSEIADIAANHGALPAYRLALGENITTPPGTFAGQSEWLTTPPVNPRLAPENGFTLAGNHYFASGYVFTPGSTLASGAAQGYTPRATLGGQLLDPYTPTGEADLLAGTAIAQFTVTADCDGKTLASTEAIYSTGQPVTVAYVNANGTAGEANAIALDGHETSLAAGTYFAGLENVNYTHGITLTGNVTLILADNCHMNVGTSGERINGYGIVPDENCGIDGLPTLTITSESLGEDMGHLSVYTTGNGNECITTGTIDINGGNITADTDGRAAFPFYAFGDLTINGGTVTATTTGTDAHAIRAIGDFNYNGGNVTATAPNGNAICAYSGNYTFSWRTPADRITIGATGLYAPAGKKTATFTRLFTDAADPADNYYGGTYTGNALNALAGKTLSGTETFDLGVTLAPKGYGTYYDSQFDITLPEGTQARIVTARGDTDGTLSYETIANGDDSSNNTVPGGTAVMLYREGGGNVTLTVHDDRTLDTRDFTQASGNDGGLVNLLHGSDVAATTTGGTLYYKLTYGSATGHEDIFGWYWGAADGAAFESPAHKAWLALPATEARSFIGLPEDETTGVTPLLSPEGDENGASPRGGLEGVAYYTLDGRKLDGTPMKSGIYVNNGKKVIIK